MSESTKTQSAPVSTPECALTERLTQAEKQRDGLLLALQEVAGDLTVVLDARDGAELALDKMNLRDRIVSAQCRIAYATALHEQSGFVPGLANRAHTTASPTQSAPDARPTDDHLWDETLRDRDTYHEWADKLANAIAIHFGVDIGEHSNANLPWAEAMDAIESADSPTAANAAGLPVAWLRAVEPGEIEDWPWPFTFVDGSANPAVLELLGAFPVYGDTPAAADAGRLSVKTWHERMGGYPDAQMPGSKRETAMCAEIADLRAALHHSRADTSAGDLLDEAAQVAIKLTAVPRDVLGPATVQMKTLASAGEKIATAIRALRPTAKGTGGVS